MATNSEYSSRKGEVLLFLILGIAFITLGVTNSDNRLFVLAGVLFILSASITWYRNRKQHTSETNDQ